MDNRGVSALAQEHLYGGIDVVTETNLDHDFAASGMSLISDSTTADGSAPLLLVSPATPDASSTFNEQFWYLCC